MSGAPAVRSEAVEPRLSVARLVTAARALLVQGGLEAVVVREVARRLDVAPSAMYKHVRGRDDLFTLLIAELYGEVTQLCERARDGVPAGRHRQRLLAAMRAFADWAREHPVEFSLVFGHPVFGYAAPADGPTLAAGQRFGAVWSGMFADVRADGRLRMTTTDHLPPALVAGLAAAPPRWEGRLGPAELFGVVMGWQRMLGLIAVEISGQLGWVLTDGRALTDHEMMRLVDDLVTPGT